MDDKRDGRKKDKKSRKSHSRSPENQRSQSPCFSRRKRDRSQSRERVRKRSRDRGSPTMRRRRGQRSPSPPPPPSMQQIPPPPMIGGAGYMAGGPVYDTYGNYPPSAGAYMGGVAGPYGGYDYGALGGPPPEGYGAIMSNTAPMMLDEPGPPGEDYGANWAPPAPIIHESEEERRKREAAIALEARNQRASLKKQRDDYKRRTHVLKKELKKLKQQRNDLCTGRDPPSPKTNSFIKENDKLQQLIVCVPLTLIRKLILAS